MRHSLMVFMLMLGLAFICYDLSFAQCPEDTIDLGACDTLSFHANPMGSSDTVLLISAWKHGRLPIYYVCDYSVGGMVLYFKVRSDCPHGISIDSLSFERSSSFIKNIGTKPVTIYSPDSLSLGIVPITEPPIAPNMPGYDILCDIWITFNSADTGCLIEMDKIQLGVAGKWGWSRLIPGPMGTGYVPRFYQLVVKLVAGCLIRGDVNADGRIDYLDMLELINVVFRQGGAKDFLAGDANMDGAVDFLDILYLIDYVFREGPPPPH